MRISTYTYVYACGPNFKTIFLLFQNTKSKSALKSTLHSK